MVSDDITEADTLRTLEIVRANIQGFRETLVPELTAATSPLTPKVAFKILVYREALSWRTLETAEGAENALSNGNLLAGIVLARATLENVAGYHFLISKLRLCIKNKSVSGLDSVAMRLLLGTRWEDWDYQSYNVLSMIDAADKDHPGIRKNYDTLSEYAHPNHSGTTLAFSHPVNAFDVEFGRYPRGIARHSKIGATSLTAALMLFEYSYNMSADLIPEIIDLCREEFEASEPQ